LEKLSVEIDGGFDGCSGEGTDLFQMVSKMAQDTMDDGPGDVAVEHLSENL
jgi:hypothetical protein